MSRLRELAGIISALDERLRPIANRPVDITKPDWAANLVGGAHPLDEAGVRGQAESVLDDVLSMYATADEKERESLRQLFTQHPSFAWAAKLPYPADTAEHFRQHLLLFSVLDLGRDSRDALLELQALCRTAQRAGLSAEAVHEAAELSSAKNRFGTGSTRLMLVQAAQSWPPPST